MNHTLLLALFAVIFSGCTKSSTYTDKEEKQALSTVTLVSANEIQHWDLDSVTPNITKCLYAKEGKLYYLNEAENEILIFNMDDSSVQKSMKMDVTGPEGVGNVSGFYVHSSDSIFLFPISQTTVFMINEAGEIIEKINYPRTAGYSEAYAISTLYSLPFWYEGNLVVKAIVDGNWNAMSSADLSKSHLSYAIGIAQNKGDVQLLPHFYPEAYWQEGKRDFTFSMVSAAESVVYSFFADHQLHVAETPFAPLKSYPAKSKYFSDEFTNLPMDGSRIERFYYFATSQRYGSLLYDPYRNLYYRFCYPAVEDVAEQLLVKVRMFPLKFSIMVLNSEFEVIGETLFSNNRKYVPENVFVAAEGLYISTAHPDNTENMEDKLSFELFSIVQP